MSDIELRLDDDNKIYLPPGDQAKVRFAVVPDPGANGLAKTIGFFADSWRVGRYAFFNDLRLFLKHLSKIVDWWFSLPKAVRIVYFKCHEDRWNDFAVFEVGTNGTLDSAPPMGISGYSLNFSIGARLVLDAGKFPHGFRFETPVGVTDMFIAGPSDTISIDPQIVDLPIIDHDYYRASTMHFTFPFEGTKMDSFDVGFRYFAEVKKREDEFKTKKIWRHFALFQRMSKKVTVRCSWDVFEPVSCIQLVNMKPDDKKPAEEIRTYLEFVLASMENDGLPSNFRTTFGRFVALKFSDSSFRLVFQKNFETGGHYLAPHGRLKLDVFGYDHSDPKPDRLWLLCGNSGAEFIKFNIGDEIEFVAGQKAHYEFPEPGEARARKKGEKSLLDDRATTSWIGFHKKGPKNGNPLVYHAQPDDAPLYAPITKGLLDEGIDADEKATDPIPMSILQWQHTSYRDVAGSPFIPMVPVDGFSQGRPSEVDTDGYVKLEACILTPERKALITKKNASGKLTTKADLLNVLGDTVTPQGLMVNLDGNNWNKIIITRSEPPTDQDLYLLSIERDHAHPDAFNELQAALEQNKPFIVMAKNPFGKFFRSEIEISDWQFETPLRYKPGQNKDGTAAKDPKRPLFIFKYHDRSVAELAGDIDQWAEGSFIEEKEKKAISDGLRDFITDVGSKLKDPKLEPYYTNIWNKLTDPYWNGVLAINANLSVTDVPDGVKCVMGGIDLKRFKAHHFGLNANRYQPVNGGKISIQRASLFGLVDYRSAQGSGAIDDRQSDPKAQFSFDVEELQALFENSALTKFNCKINLGVFKIFHQDVKQISPPGISTGKENSRKIVIYGTYETKGEKDLFTFATHQSFIIDFDKEFIEKLRIHRIQLTTEAEKAGKETHGKGTATDVYGKFTLTGQIVPSDKTERLLCFKNLGFYDLGIGMSFTVTRTENDDGSIDYESTKPNLYFVPGTLSFDLSNTEACPTALLQRLPLQLTSLYFPVNDPTQSVGDANLPKLQDLGFLPIRASQFHYGLGLDLDLGFLGGLVDALKNFQVQLLLGWRAGSANKVDAVGIRFPGKQGKLEFGIPGYFNMSAEKFDIISCPSRNEKPIPPEKESFYIIVLRNCRVQFLGLDLPGSGNKFHIYLFANPKAYKSKMGWFGGLEVEDNFFGAGQRLEMAVHGTPTFDSIIKTLKSYADIKPTCDNYDPQSESHSLRYNPENNLTAAMEYTFCKALKLGVVWNDPNLYALRISLPELNFRIDIAYTKITDELGKYYTDVALPIPPIQAGAVSIDIPNVAIEIYTNGDFKVDVGFPEGLDYSRSFKLQYLILIGAGGFYVGRLMGLTTDLITVGPGDKVAVFGLGLRVGIGREFEYDIFRFGISVNVYGVLEGAIALKEKLFPPEKFVLAGRVGLFAQLFGLVDFGIVKVAVEILIDTGMPFMIKKEGEDIERSVPYIDASVDVRIEVVIGRIRIWRETIQISVKFDYHTCVKWRIEEEKKRLLPYEITPLTWLAPPLGAEAVAAAVVAEGPLEIFLVPSVTLAHDENGDMKPAMVVMLGMEYGNEEEPTKSFDHLCELIKTRLISAHRASWDIAGRPREGDPVTADELGLVLSRLVKAHSDRSNVTPFKEYDAIVRDWLKPVGVRLVGPEGPESTLTCLAFFPMIPDLILHAEQAGVNNHKFWDHPMVGPTYEKCVKEWFDESFVREPPPAAPSKSIQDAWAGENKPFTQFVFEAYFHGLSEVVVKVFRDVLKESGKTGVSLSEPLGKILSSSNGGSTNLGASTDKVRNQSPYAQIAAMMTDFFASGLRWPIPPKDAAPADCKKLEQTDSIFRLTGQQFVMEKLPTESPGDCVKPAHLRPSKSYPVELKRRPGTEWDWITVGGPNTHPVTGEPLRKPEVGRDSFDPCGMKELIPSNLPSLPTGDPAELGGKLQLSPYNEKEKQYTFPETIFWTNDGSSPKERRLWPVPAGLRQEMESADEEYGCPDCSYVYDPAEGDPEHEVEPGTIFSDVPVTWKCPKCKARKDRFKRCKLTVYLKKGTAKAAAGPGNPAEPIKPPPVKGSWAVRMEFLLRRVPDLDKQTEYNEKTDNTPKFLKSMYEIGGMDEENRRLLESLMDAAASTWVDLNKARLSILYPDPKFTYKSFRSDKIVREDKPCTDRKPCEVILLKTNLCTESRPFELDKGKVENDEEVYHASMGCEPGRFLRLLWQCGVVNSGGFFLWYDVAKKDPLCKVFDEQNVTELRIPLVIELHENTIDGSRPFYNCVAMDDRDFIHPSGKEAEDESSDVFKLRLVDPTTIDHLFAELKRDGVAVLQKDEVMEPGCIGFRLERNRAVYSPGSYELDNLYSRLYIEIEKTPLECRQNIRSLAVKPVCPKKDKGAINGDVDETKWVYERIIPLFKRGKLDLPGDLGTQVCNNVDADWPEAWTRTIPSRYAGIGGTVDVAFGYRDIFGNEHGRTTVPFKIKYFDRLVPVSEWPGVKSVLDCDGQGLRVTLKFEEPIELKDENGLPLSYGQPIKDRVKAAIHQYTRIVDQLADPNAKAEIKSTLLPNRSTNVKAQICCFAMKILSYWEAYWKHLNEGHLFDPEDVPSPFSISLDKNSGDYDNDFFEIETTLEIFRTEPEGKDLFWRKGAVERVSSFIEPKIIAALEGHRIQDEQTLETFAGKLQTAFPSMKVAVGVGSRSSKALWAVRKECLNLEISGLKFKATIILNELEVEKRWQEPVYFAPKPLSTKLMSGQVVPAKPYVFEKLDAMEEEEKPIEVTDVDLDDHFRFFLNAVNRLVEPETLSSWVCLSQQTPADSDFGRGKLKELMEHKEKLAKKTPEALLMALFKNKPHCYPGIDSIKCAQQAFSQRIRNNLESIYGIESIMQFLVEPPKVIETEKSGINILGKIAIDPEASPAKSDAESVGKSQAVNLGDAKIRFRKKNSSEYKPSVLTVMVDVDKVEKAEHYDKKLTYIISHIERNIQPRGGGPTDDICADESYVSSSWLKLVSPPRVPIQPKSDREGDKEVVQIAVPLRDHPRPVDFELQTFFSRPTDKGAEYGEILKNAVIWDYEFDYSVFMAAQDEIILEVVLNSPPKRPLATWGPQDLFNALVRFRQRFPEPERLCNRLRVSNDDDEKKKFIEEFIQYAKAVDPEHLGQTAFQAIQTTATHTRVLKYRVTETLNPAGTERTITICQIDGPVVSTEAATIETLLTEEVPIVGPAEEKCDTPQYKCFSQTIKEPLVTDRPEAADKRLSWRRRRIRIKGLNVLKHENAKASARLLRNTSLIGDEPEYKKHETAGEFVYETPVTGFIAPLTPLIIHEEEIPVATSENVLRTHLTELMKKIFKDLEDDEPRRRIKDEARFDFLASVGSDAVRELSGSGEERSKTVKLIPIPQPVRLCSPFDLEHKHPDTDMTVLASELKKWHTAFNPTEGGRIVLDLMVYSFLTKTGKSQEKEEEEVASDMPTLRLRKLVLPFGFIDWDEQPTP